MRRRPFRRLVAALAVLALLLAGFAASSVAADSLPCAMPMTVDASVPCDHDHDRGADHAKQGAATALMCFAKCPLPMPDSAAAPRCPTLAGTPLLLARQATPPGIGIAPPLEPPRV